VSATKQEKEEIRLMVQLVVGIMTVRGTADRYDWRGIVDDASELLHMIEVTMEEWNEDAKKGEEWDKLEKMSIWRGIKTELDKLENKDPNP
jgi:hypothetical protein